MQVLCCSNSPSMLDNTTQQSHDSNLVNGNCSLSHSNSPDSSSEPDQRIFSPDNNSTPVIDQNLPYPQIGENASLSCSSVSSPQSSLQSDQSDLHPNLQSTPIIIAGHVISHNLEDPHPPGLLDSLVLNSTQSISLENVSNLENFLPVTISPGPQAMPTLEIFQQSS